MDIISSQQDIKLLRYISAVVTAEFLFYVNKRETIS